MMMLVTATIEGKTRELHVVSAQWDDEKEIWGVSICIAGKRNDHFIGYGHTLEEALRECVDEVKKQGVGHFHELDAELERREAHAQFQRAQAAAPKKGTARSKKVR